MKAAKEIVLAIIPAYCEYTDQHGKIQPLRDTMRYFRLIRKYHGAGEASRFASSDAGGG
jgi:hypothetical protein